MPTRAPHRLAGLTLGALVLVGCWASHERLDETGTDGCARPRGLVSPLVQRLSSGRCVLDGPDEIGAIWTAECDSTSCTLWRDGEQVCACDAPDFANTCANGVPTCAHWPYFDYTEVEFVVGP